MPETSQHRVKRKSEHTGQMIILFCGEPMTNTKMETIWTFEAPNRYVQIATTIMWHVRRFKNSFSVTFKHQPHASALYNA